jgi:LysR family hydrogen peroxide-inducible transcriptional activator
MTVSWLTLRDLEYVIAVAKHEHFGRAAQECHVSQPSLSTQIKKIEGYLGTVLFERTNRRVKTTPAGKKMAEQAAVVLDEARKIPTLLGQTTTNRFEALKLGVISSLAPLVPYVLADLKKAFPGSALTLHEATTQELVRELKAGGLDAVVAADTIRDEALTKIPLFFEPFVLAAPKGHPILTRAIPKLADLKASEMVLLDEGHCLRDQALGFCPVSRRGKPREFHATSVDTLQHLVASGAGYTLLPGLAAKEARMGSLISYRKFEDDKVGRRIVLLCRGQSAGLEPFRRLARTLSEAVAA